MSDHERSGDEPRCARCDALYDEHFFRGDFACCYNDGRTLTYLPPDAQGDLELDDRECQRCGGRINPVVCCCPGGPDAPASRPSRAEPDGAKGESPWREGTCDTCRVEYPIWVAPNWLWNQVGADGFLCLNCFAKLAESKGVHPTAWMLVEETEETMKFALPRTQPSAAELEIDAIVGGRYQMGDGRDFWIDHEVAQEIARRVVNARRSR